MRTLWHLHPVVHATSATPMCCSAAGQYVVKPSLAGHSTPALSASSISVLPCTLHLGSATSQHLPHTCLIAVQAAYCNHHRLAGVACVVPHQAGVNFHLKPVTWQQHVWRSGVAPLSFWAADSSISGSGTASSGKVQHAVLSKSLQV